MYKETTAENNKLIALFMGYKFTYPSQHPSVFPKGTWDKDGKGVCAEKGLCFHSSWDWIHPVLDKIASVTSEHDEQFAGLSIFEIGLFSEIETVYTSIVQYVNWYNKKTQ